MTRIIHYSNKDGREGVFFTEDLELDANDVIPPGCTLYQDVTIDEDMPGAFPMDYNLERKF